MWMHRKMTKPFHPHIDIQSEYLITHVQILVYSCLTRDMAGHWDLNWGSPTEYFYAGHSDVQLRLQVRPVQNILWCFPLLFKSVITQNVDMWPRPSPWYRLLWPSLMSPQLYPKSELSHLWSLCLVHDWFSLVWSLPSTLPFTSRGGVYTPGAAFAKTTLIDRLKKHGIQFSVI